MAHANQLFPTPVGPVKIKLSADYQNKAGNTGQNEVPYPGTYIQLDPDRVGDSNVYDSRSNAPSYQTLKDGGASAAIDVDLGFATLSSITAHREGTAGLCGPARIAGNADRQGRCRGRSGLSLRRG